MNTPDSTQPAELAIETAQQIEAPIGPGLYEVRYISTGGLYGFSASDNVAQTIFGHAGEYDEAGTLGPTPEAG